MTAALTLPLLVLALVDSTSFGTLLIPIWLLLTPGRLQAGRVLRYLVWITAFYFIAGIVLAAGALQVADTVITWFESVPPVTLAVGQLIIGIIVVLLSYVLEAQAKHRQGRPGRMTRWRDSAMTEAGTGRGIGRLAIIAAALEVVTMVPYLIAIGILTASDISFGTFIGALGVYCLVMVIPALVLLILRVTARDRIEPALRRISDWFGRNSAKAVGWTVGGIGITLIINAVVRLVTI